MDPKKRVAQLSDKAKKILRDQQAFAVLLEKASEKLGSNRVLLRDSYKDFQTLIRLLRAWMTGKYKEIPKKSIISMLAALIYFVNPFDAIPDFLLHFGFLDDITVLVFVIKSVREEIEKYRNWEASTPSKSES